MVLSVVQHRSFKARSRGMSGWNGSQDGVHADPAEGLEEPPQESLPERHLETHRHIKALHHCIGKHMRMRIATCLANAFGENVSAFGSVRRRGRGGWRAGRTPRTAASTPESHAAYS